MGFATSFMYRQICKMNQQIVAYSELKSVELPQYCGIINALWNSGAKKLKEGIVLNDNRFLPTW